MALKLEAAILRLPVETMAEIFELSQLALRDRSHNQHIDPNMHEIAFTHVCKYWRDIAINTPRLWAHLDIERHANPEQTGAYLERSGTSPLDVYYNGNSYECLCLVFDHLHRIRKLHIQEMRQPDHTHLVVDLINRPAPLLEEFTFKAEWNTEIDIKSFFAGQAPKLVSLSLGIEPITWANVPMMQNLRDLNISCEQDLDLMDLFHIILQNPMYETLSILRVHDFGLEHVSPFLARPNIGKITMPFLKNFSILDSTYTALSELFRSVEFPALERWDIVCRHFYLEYEAAGNHKDVIPQTYGGSNYPLSMEITVSSKCATITACSSDTVECKSPLRRSAYLWDSRLSINDALDFIVELIKGDFWCSALELTVDVWNSRCWQYWEVDGGDSAHWKALFELLPQLRKLTVRNISATIKNNPYLEEPVPDGVDSSQTHLGLLSALGSHPDGCLTGNGICANLRELHLCGFSLWDRIEVIRALEPLHDRIRWGCGEMLSLFRVTDVLVSDSTQANIRLLQESGVARTIEVVL